MREGRSLTVPQALRRLSERKVQEYRRRVTLHLLPLQETNICKYSKWFCRRPSGQWVLGDFSPRIALDDALAPQCPYYLRRHAGTEKGYDHAGVQRQNDVRFIESR